MRLIGVDPLTAPTGPRAGRAVGRGDRGRFVAGGRGLWPGRRAGRDAGGAGARRGAGGGAGDRPDRHRAWRCACSAATAGFDRLVVAAEQPLGRPPLDEIAPTLELRRAGEAPDVAQLTGSFHLNLTAFGALSFAVGLVIVQSAIGLAFEARRPVVRTLRALGVPLRTLVLVLAAELAGWR